jgi:hypothetical protein
MVSQKTSNDFTVELLVQPNVSTAELGAALKEHFQGTRLPHGLTATVKTIGQQIPFKPGMPIEFSVQPQASEQDFGAALKEHLDAVSLPGPEPISATVKGVTVAKKE